MQSARVLLTGASGFTGRHLRRELEQRGAQVTACNRGVDITDAVAVTRAVKAADPTHIVHLAGVSFTNLDDADIYDRVNVEGSRHVLQAAANHAPNLSHITLASSAAIYGPPQKPHVSEDQIPAPRTAYARSKLAMEGLAESFEELAPILIVRPFNYTGPGQPARFIVPKIVDHFARRADKIALGNTSTVREFSDVRDAVTNYVNLIEARASGPVNLCTGRGHSISDVLDRLSDLTGHQIETETNPDFIRADDIVSLIGDPARLLCLGGQPPRFTLSETLSEMLKKAV